jgi:hypothetical protein
LQLEGNFTRKPLRANVGGLNAVMEMDSISACFQENLRCGCPKIGDLRREVQEMTREHPDTHLWRITQRIIQKYNMSVRRADMIYKWSYEVRYNKKYNPDADYKTDVDAPVFGVIFITDRDGNRREVSGVREDVLDQRNIRAESMRRAGLIE